MANTDLKIRDRKAKRKEERKAKKKRKLNHDDDGLGVQSSQKVSDSRETKKEKQNNLKTVNRNNKQKKVDSYAHLDPELAAALQRDDEEIAELEAKLGKEKEKARLHKEYAKLEGYGDDFGDFLDDLDILVKGVVTGDDCKQSYKTLHSDDGDKNDDSSDSEDEEVVPMKEPAFDDIEDIEDEDDWEEYKNEIMQLRQDEEKINNQSKDGSSDSGSGDMESESESESEESAEGSSSDSEDDKEEASDDENTYKPAKGEDIYGNTVEMNEVKGDKAQKYVPPHLRNKDESTEDDEARQESLLAIQKLLNSSLNRLSEDSVVPVTQSIATLYASHPKSDVNECLWKITKNACIARSFQMTALIPVYICALAGVHLQKGDSAQLGEYLIENVILDLVEELKKARDAQQPEDDEDEEIIKTKKQVCNLVLVLCYLYNYAVVHCTLIYDVVRDLIKSLKEIDVELLLLILSHCGRSLRSDDPSALKEIVQLVQKGAADRDHKKSSRVGFMVSAIMDLKNNKRRKKDEALSEKTSKLRRALGQIKSGFAAMNHRTSDVAARITLDDILNAETKGRWWKIGASWVGNQYRYDEGKEGGKSAEHNAVEAIKNPENEKLLKLADKLRMNTDIRRSIFCIIMGSADYEDCFEKLVRGGMLKNRTERDTVRVLMECCGNEKAYNKFYSHLSARICEYQMQCKFTFQLAFWDMFKQFEDISARKAANLAKLLSGLVAVHKCVRLNVLKAIDMSAPEDLPQNAMIFLTIFFSSLFEHFDDASAMQNLFNIGSTQRKGSEDDEDAIGHVDEAEALRASITVFLVQVMKASPKYKKGSKFRVNLKAAIKACDPDNFF